MRSRKVAVVIGVGERCDCNVEITDVEGIVF